MKPEFFIGLDLGQSCDFTAVAVLERTAGPGDWDPVAYAPRKVARLLLRHLERVPLGTPYPEIVSRVGKIMGVLEELGSCHLVADATGVGRPVVDLLRLEPMKCRLWPVTITGGDAEREAAWSYRVPKRDLIVGVQVLLSAKELEIASGMKWGSALVAEMAAMKVRVTERAREQYGAGREGEHDDLVLAVSLACWGVRRVHNQAAGDVGHWVRRPGGSLF